MLTAGQIERWGGGIPFREVLERLHVAVPSPTHILEGRKNPTSEHLIADVYSRAKLSVLSANVFGCARFLFFFFLKNKGVQFDLLLCPLEHFLDGDCPQGSPSVLLKHLPWHASFPLVEQNAVSS